MSREKSEARRRDREETKAGEKNEREDERNGEGGAVARAEIPAESLFQ